MTKPCRYITTPIYYVNDRPHIGHVYTSTLCDVWARFMRFSGDDVFFLTGTDEHGVKVENSAKARGISPHALADENAAEFQRIMRMFEVTNDDFIRTTSDSHMRQVKSFVEMLQAADAVYPGEFEGWYDEGEEEYITETKARDNEFKSAVTGRALVRATEKNYYFRLSAFQEPLEKLFEEQPNFVRPAARRNEVLGRLREGLNDVPISRSNFTWGIGMPGDPEHVIYVWIDALLNYATGLGMAEPDSEVCKERIKYWPADYHVIGKEILWFHAVIWPAILMALKLPLPKCVYAHSFWIAEGTKMSKSLGNFIDLERIQGYIDTYGADMWRYYLTTQGPLGATDADFVAGHFHEVYESDLVNTVGNCASRVTAMVGKYFDGVVPTEAPAGERLLCGDHDWPTITAASTETAVNAMDNFDLVAATASGMNLIRKVDGFIQTTAPFKLAKDDGRRDELGAILYQCLEAIRIASLLLWPTLNHKMEQLWDVFGLEMNPRDGKLAELAQWGGLPVGGSVVKVALFPRIDAPQA
ncbi:MAG: methionyl-tRNA synthetase [Planctomycetota bacterium]|jgi:methionyl-tRNA synthetase